MMIHKQHHLSSEWPWCYYLHWCPTPQQLILFPPMPPNQFQLFSGREKLSSMPAGGAAPASAAAAPAAAAEEKKGM